MWNSQLLKKLHFILSNNPLGVLLELRQPDSLPAQKFGKKWWHLGRTWVLEGAETSHSGVVCLSRRCRLPREDNVVGNEACRAHTHSSWLFSSWLSLTWRCTWYWKSIILKKHAERMQTNLMPKRQSSQQKAGMTEGTTISSATEGVDTPPPTIFKHWYLPSYHHP